MKSSHDGKSHFIPTSARFLAFQSKLVRRFAFFSGAPDVLSHVCRTSSCSDLKIFYSGFRAKSHARVQSPETISEVFVRSSVEEIFAWQQMNSSEDGLILVRKSLQLKVPPNLFVSSCIYWFESFFFSQRVFICCYGARLKTHEHFDEHLRNQMSSHLILHSPWNVNLQISCKIRSQFLESESICRYF